ncbi:retinoic acid receptor responder protein 1 [Gopherus flavomarginatus]|uniref:retinoic acid receptor responder protein 1 n=1 Tax=Gopherus flavomarginatus TaxID=286002 RepID=UPI0021CC25B0|nr:retinoic acid receptor responder protein 1 [Gopherus flavomarginatus]
MQRRSAARLGPLLLLLLLPLAWGAGPSPPRADRELQVSSRLAGQAARVALHYLNYRLGSPSALRALGQVRKATVKTIPGIGHKYYLQFTTEDYKSSQNVGTCLATVLYLKRKPRPAVNINCTYTKDQKQTREDDYSFYKKLRQQTKPITGNDIPDSYGHIEPALEPAWALAVAGSSYLMWEKSTENLGYFMAQVKNVKQWITKDDSIDFDYLVILHEIPTQEMISCHLRVIWTPGHPLKVKYFCLSENQRSESGEGSGTESGSTNGIFNEEEANF